MSDFRPAPLPPRPNKSVDSVFELQGANSFPEAQAIPLQYVQPSPVAQPVQQLGLQPPAPLGQVNPPVDNYSPQYQQPLAYNQQPVYQQQPEPIYYTPAQYGQANNPGYDIPQQALPWMLPQSFSPRSSAMKTLAWVGASIGALLLLCILGFSSLTYGFSTSLISMILAFFPLAMITACLIWVGRWDAEPWGMRILAFLWGAGGSIALTLGFTYLANLLGLSPDRSDIFAQAALQAPPIEEFSKGIGMLLIALFLRRYFDGPVDGVVYMATIASGFAFTENILYFGASEAQAGAAGLGSTFILRAVMSPFAHVIFSIPMGIAVGIARQRGFSTGKTIGLFFLAYPLSFILHGLWNASSSILTDTWFVFYILVQVPIFAAAVFVVIWLRKTEAKITYKRLTEYGWAGWFTPQEVDSFSTWQGRKQVYRWAKSRSPQAGTLMKDITKDVVKLAYVREKIARGNISDGVLEQENEILNRVSTNKSYLLAI